MKKRNFISRFGVIESHVNTNTDAMSMQASGR